MPKRKNNWTALFILLGEISICAGCGSTTAPQSPSHRSSEVTHIDSSQLLAMEYNNQLVDQAKRAVQYYVQNDSTHSYEQLEGGAWISGTASESEARMPQDGEDWKVDLKVSDLSGETLFEMEDVFTIGHNELPSVVNLAIDKMHQQESARVVAPWYMAFGSTGTEQVPPYTNVVIQIQIDL